MSFNVPTRLLFTAAVLCTGLSSTASAVTLSNDIPGGTLGATSVEVRNAGELDTYEFTGENAATGELTTQDVIFDYYAAFATPGDSGELGEFTTGSADQIGPYSVISRGTFSNGSNNVDWIATSVLEADSTVFTTTYEFEALNGSLGDVLFSQYLDEDVFLVSDDIAFTVGSTETADLTVFTIDSGTALGVGQTAGYTAESGLVNASFVGYAIDNYDDLQFDLQAGTRTQAVDIDLEDLETGSLADLGFFSDDSTFNDVVTYGPRDIVSALTFRLDADATTATVTTILGGVVDLASTGTVSGGGLPTPPPTPVDPTPDPDPMPMPQPEPDDPVVIPTPSAAAGGLALLGLAGLRRRRA